MLYSSCVSLIVSIYGSLLFVNGKPLLIIFCIFNFCVLVRDHRGMGGYSSKGMRSVFTSVALILGVKWPKHLSLANIPLPLSSRL